MSTSPYLGLRPYSEAESDRFFGREQEIHILTDKILAHRLTLLVAASGVGKSSLLQAGVMPALRAQGMIDLIYHNAWAGDDPAQELKQSIVQHFVEQKRITADYQPDMQQPLAQFLQSHALLGVGTVVILLDQFEEFFYYQRHSVQRERFVEQLAQAVHDSDTPTAFIFSMREDFAMELTAFKPWLKGIFDNIYRIEKLSLAAAQLAITEPARAVGCEYAPDLLQQLLQDLGTERREEQLDLTRLSNEDLLPPQVEPPHLQIVCQELWLQHTSRNQLTLADYEKLGRASGILQNYFKHKMTALGREQQRLASLAFDLLVNQHGAKMAYPLQELAQQLHVDKDALEATLEELQKAAILRRSQRQHQLWYELYHDIFARSIVEWNQDYKKRQLRRKLIIRGSAISAVLLSILLAFDGWQNHHDRHYRLGAETISEQIELYQGKHDSWDVFHQQHFLYETDYQRSDIEADKRFEAAPLPELAQEMRLQVGQLPLDKRFSAYAGAGLLEPADLVAGAIARSKNNELIGNVNERIGDAAAGLVANLLALHMPSSLQRLYDFPGKTLDEKMYWLGKMPAQSVIHKLLPLLNDPDENVSNGAAFALAQQGNVAAIPKLLNLLGSKNASFAAVGIGQLKADEAIPKLLVLLNDKDHWTRLAAIDTLGRLNAGIAVPKLLTLLDEDDDDVRAAVVMTLLRLRAATAVPKLISLLDSRGGASDSYRYDTFGGWCDNNFRRAAIYALADMKADNAIPKLLTLMGDKNSRIRVAAVAALGQLNAKAAIARAFVLLESKDDELRSAAIYALGQLNASIAIPKLLPLLEDRTGDVRGHAVFALGKLNARAAIPKLLDLLEDKDDRVRRAAVEALGNLNASAAIPRLLTLLEDKDHWVRYTAMEALGKLNASSTIPKMLTFLEDKDDGMRRATVEALGKLNARPAIPKLLTLLENKDDRVLSAAVQALGKLNISAAIPKLMTYLESKGVEERRDAAAALSKLNARVATPKLLTLLKDGNDGVRQEAARAMGEMRVDVTAPQLLKLLTDIYDDVRESSAWSLGRLQAKSAAPALLKLLADNQIKVQLSAVLALNRIGATSPELTQWQTQTLAKARTVLNDAHSDTNDKIRVIQAVRAVNFPEAAALLSSQLQSSDLEMLKTALQSIASLGTNHPEWLQPALPRLLELTRHADVNVKLKAVAALGGMITFANGHVLPAVDQPVQVRLLQLAQDGKASEQLRLAALDALGKTERHDLGKQMVPLLQDPVLQLRAAFWLTQLDYREALPELQKALGALVAEKQAWRAKRDATPRRAEDDNSVKKADASWQKTADEYQYAYAVARLAPDAQAIPLLAHPLYQVRRAAQLALAERPSGDLVRALLAYHQAFAPRDLPSPLPYSTYRALDQVLLQLESRGTAKDLEILKAAKAKGINPPMQTQKRAITERLEWTIAELEARLKAGKP